MRIEIVVQPLNNPSYPYSSFRELEKLSSEGTLASLSTRNPGKSFSPSGFRVLRPSNARLSAREESLNSGMTIGENLRVVELVFLGLLILLMDSYGAFADSPEACKTQPSSKTYPSLFFTDEEVARICATAQDVTSLESLSLSAILYTDLHHWSLWINDKIIRPDNTSDLEGFHIEKVTPHEVTFSSLSSEGEIVETVTLCPRGRE